MILHWSMHLVQIHPNGELFSIIFQPHSLCYKVHSKAKNSSRGFERWHVVMDKMLQCSISSSQHPLSNWITDPLLSALGLVSVLDDPPNFVNCLNQLNTLSSEMERHILWLIDRVTLHKRGYLHSSASSSQAKSKHIKYEYEFKTWIKDNFPS